jgi:hypothetical protein
MVDERWRGGVEARVLRESPEIRAGSTFGFPA